MSIADVVPRFNAGTQNVSPGVSFWADVLVYKATMHAAQVQWEQGEKVRALNAEMVELNRKLVALTKSIDDVTKGLWVIGIASLVAALVALFT